MNLVMRGACIKLVTFPSPETDNVPTSQNVDLKGLNNLPPVRTWQSAHFCHLNPKLILFNMNVFINVQFLRDHFADGLRKKQN